MLLGLGKLSAQGNSPFIDSSPGIYAYGNICICNDSIYISNEYEVSGVSKSKIKSISLDFKYDTTFNSTNYSFNQTVSCYKNRLVTTSGLKGRRNEDNGSFSTWKDGIKTGPIIIGDSDNYNADLIPINDDLIYTGTYSGILKVGTGSIWNGFVARYSITGNKIWEKYYRTEIHNYRSAYFKKSFITKDQNILVFGLAYNDSNFQQRHIRVIITLIDSNGTLLNIESPLDSFEIEYDQSLRRFIFPMYQYTSFAQINDSLFCAYVYDDRHNGLGYWMYFNEGGKLLNYRKAWLSRDSIANPKYFDSAILGLIQKKDKSGYYAIQEGSATNPANRLISLDNEFYLSKVNGDPYLKELNNSHLVTYLYAFVEDDNGDIYTLNSLQVDSLQNIERRVLVCKLDSNGTLISNGPCLPPY